MMQSLDRQWNGQPSETSVQYLLSVEQNRLEFRAVFPSGSRCHPEAVAGEFTPELWRWDVAEYFIAGRAYLEVNLAPNGAWWIQGFSEVREIDPQFDISQLDIQAYPEELRISIGLDGLERYLGSRSQWRGNVTAIINSPEYQYLSMIRLSGNQADFHQPSVFARNFWIEG